jgi:hypothetical protein
MFIFFTRMSTNKKGYYIERVVRYGKGTILVSVVHRDDDGKIVKVGGRPDFHVKVGFPECDIHIAHTHGKTITVHIPGKVPSTMDLSFKLIDDRVVLDEMVPSSPDTIAEMEKKLKDREKAKINQARRERERLRKYLSATEATEPKVTESEEPEATESEEPEEPEVTESEVTESEVTESEVTESKFPIPLVELSSKLYKPDPPKTKVKELVLTKVNDAAVNRGLEAVRLIFKGTKTPPHETGTENSQVQYEFDKFFKDKYEEMIKKYIETGEKEDEHFNIRNDVIGVRPYDGKIFDRRDVAIFRWLTTIINFVKTFATEKRESWFIIYANNMWDLSFYMMNGTYNMQSVIPLLCDVEYRAIRLAMTFKGNCTIDDWPALMKIAEHSPNIKAENSHEYGFRISIEAESGNYGKQRTRLPPVLVKDINIPHGTRFSTDYGKDWLRRLNEADQEGVWFGDKREYKYHILREWKIKGHPTWLDASQVPKSMKPRNCASYDNDEAADLEETFKRIYGKYIEENEDRDVDGIIHNGLYLVTYGVL